MKARLILIVILFLILTGCSENAAAPVEERPVAVPAVLVATTAPTAASASAVTTPEAPPPTDNWRDLYYAELMKYRDAPAAMFNLCDLDADGIPELLLSEGSYHVAGGKLYTVQEDALVYLGEYGGYGEFQYDFARHYLHSSFFQMGTGILMVYHYENGTLTEVANFYDYDGSFPAMPNAEYKINDVAVDEETFDAEYEAYAFDSSEDFAVGKYEVTPDNIESVLRQY